MLTLGSLKQSLTLGNSVLDGSYVEEGLLRQVVYLAVENHVEALDGVLDRNHHAGDACELLGYGERLREEALNAACAVHGELVLVREFVHTKDGDDVLQLLVALQNLLNALCALVVSLAHDERVEDTRCRAQRVDSRIDTKLGDLTRELGVKVVAGAGSVKSSAGTYTACTDVIEPFFVEVMRSCILPISLASVG